MSLNKTYVTARRRSAAVCTTFCNFKNDVADRLVPVTHLAKAALPGMATVGLSIYAAVLNSDCGVPLASGFMGILAGYLIGERLTPCFPYDGYANQSERIEIMRSYRKNSALLGLSLAPPAAALGWGLFSVGRELIRAKGVHI